MGIERILIIDDEMHPGGSREPRYGRLSEADLSIKIKSFLEAQGFSVEFSEKGEDALEIIKSDANKEIKIVFLDIIFNRVETRIPGGTEIFRRMRELRGDLPIVVITILPTRKIPEREDIFKEFVDLGASLYIEKKYFIRRGVEQINYVNAVARRQNVQYFLLYCLGLDSNKDEILDIDIMRKDESQKFSILKEPHRIKSPMSDYIEQCIQSFPNPVHWKENALIREKMTSTDFAKAIFKLNDVLMRKSSGRIPNFIKRVGPQGWTLNVHKIEQM